MSPPEAEMPPPTCDLSICIANWNARDYLARCLESIGAQSAGLSVEIIVVDNGSTDGSVQCVRQRFPSVTLIENTANVGFVQATNQAMRLSRGRYVLWLNNDTVVLDQALARLVQFMDEHPAVGICGPKVLNRDGTIQNQCRRGFPTPWAAFAYFSGLSRLFPRREFFSRYLMTYCHEDEVHEVDAVSGCCLLARRQVVEQAGLIDTAYHSYGEELDYCAVAKERGWTVYYYPPAVIVHYGGQGGSGVRPYHSIYQFYRSMWLFYRRHVAGRYWFVFNWAVGSAIWAKCGVALLANLFRRQKVIGSAKP
jgi:GT2 family glycosyltransferase